MKKLLLVLAIGAFAACNDNTNETETPQDMDTIQQAPTFDTMPSTIDTSGAAVDTSGAL